MDGEKRMAITYTNCRGNLYFLHSKKTKNGNLRYHFSKEEVGNLVDDLPEGYEIYEDPNGKVSLRRKQVKLIHDEELKVIEEGMKAHCEIKDFKLDVKKDVVSIYTKPDVSISLEDLFPGVSASILTPFINYETEMRFKLVDKKDRTFVVERYCFLGGIEDWMELESSNDLKALVEEYVQHIGQDSMYDLF